MANYGVFSRLAYAYLQRFSLLDTEGYVPGGPLRQHFMIWPHRAYSDPYMRWHLEFSWGDMGAQ